MAETKKRRSHRQKARRKRKIHAGLLGAAAFYLCGIVFFHTHYFPGTKVGDIPIGLRSRASAEKYLEKQLGEFVMTVEEKDGNEKLKAQDVGLEYTNLGSIRGLLERQKASCWGYEIMLKHPHTALQVKVDKEKLSDAIDRLDCMEPEKPVESQNAEVVYSKSKKRYAIKAETVGNIVDKKHFMEGAEEAFCGLNSRISLKDETFYVQPKYTSKSKKVREARDTMNKYLKATVTYSDGGLKTKMTKRDVRNFLKCSGNYKVTFCKKNIKKYIRKSVAKTFNSIDGDVPSGITAWKVSEDRESKKIIENLKKGKAVTRKPVYANEGLNRDEYNLGKTFIDVNISDQCMWYVEGGKVVFSSDVVTGNLSTGHGTSTGIYHIAYRQRDHLMVKYNSFVHYWMPYNTTVGIGFHDANWRSRFGGQIYRTDGSHGCINMPPSKAAELFYMISAGTTVYVHY